MMTCKLVEKPSFTEQAAVLKIKQCKEVGTLLMLKKHVRKQHRYGCSRAYHDLDEFEIVVPGVKGDTLAKIMKGFSRSFVRGGHGGYRFDYSIEEREIDLEAIVRQEERGRVKQKLNELRGEMTAIELRLSDERKRHWNELRVLTGDLKDTRQRLRILDREHKHRTANLQDRIEVMNHKLKELEAPLLTILLRRFKRFVSS